MRVVIEVKLFMYNEGSDGGENISCFYMTHSPSCYTILYLEMDSNCWH